MDLNLELDSILCLNTDAFSDNSYFGKVISTGDVAFNGQPDLVSIDFNGISDNLFDPSYYNTHRKTEIFIHSMKGIKIPFLSFFT